MLCVGTGIGFCTMQKTRSCVQCMLIDTVEDIVSGLQEFIDSTQGMVKDMHTAQGSLFMRINSIESNIPAQATEEPESVRNLKVRRLLPW